MGLLATRTGIPAAPLAGALIGAAMVSMSGRLEVAQWPTGTKTCLEIAIGTVIGTGLTRTSLDQLQQLWKPAVLITLTLVLTGIVVGLWSSRLLGVDPLVTLLGAAPGGISGMSLVGADYGVGAAVAALHAVRLITVLLVIPVVVKLQHHLGWVIPDSGLDRATPIDILVSDRFNRPAMALLRQRLALLLSLAGIAGLGLTPLEAIAGTPEA
eukprot:CAMPEP_0175959138 /NCGR_PEP_ID=MMETSP0108-20121206/34639_1 /TAXON_ID=195067 ORGANISM="Goniomonas pacifica, Strain CCMP1869" /NCGR_SAMPLE_ID=MMETSP0108 /ASSEMBLY_ACC=CAM_ASM_000204 /LENGTH=211 /DNA_ID=CAMNT_0017286575 /DNA_START=1056 /DNA_END=1688 /DNA_ORIENTATION=+